MNDCPLLPQGRSFVLACTTIAYLQTAVAAERHFLTCTVSVVPFEVDHGGGPFIVIIVHLPMMCLRSWLMGTWGAAPEARCCMECAYASPRGLRGVGACCWSHEKERGGGLTSKKEDHSCSPLPYSDLLFVSLSCLVYPVMCVYLKLVTAAWCRGSCRTCRSHGRHGIILESSVHPQEFIPFCTLISTKVGCLKAQT